MKLLTILIIALSTNKQIPYYMDKDNCTLHTGTQCYEVYTSSKTGRLFIYVDGKQRFIQKRNK